MATVRLPDHKLVKVKLDQTELEAPNEGEAIALANEIFANRMPVIAQLAAKLTPYYLTAAEDSFEIGNVEVSWTEVEQLGPEPRHRGREPRRA